jgi:hypothetical protein
MNCKRILGAVVLFLLFSFSASASTVSFLVVETGLNDGIATPQSSSRIWEEGLMAFFFDAGHIVTNNPILRMDEQVPAEIRGTIVEYDFREAITGGAEYFVLGFLEYEIQGSRAAAVKMNIKIYSTFPEELVFEQVFPAGRSTSEENVLVRNAGRTIISHIKDR